MAIQPFLAMTAGEFRENTPISSKIAWMACHFSPYGRGLSNLPRNLPEGSVLMVDDITPICSHDFHIIAQQLEGCAKAFGCRGVLLDFQRPDCEEAAALAASLVTALPCPVAVSEDYARELDCPVFLSPAAPSVALADHLAPWTGREIWLDLSPAGEVITLTEQGAESACLPYPERKAFGFSDDFLHCHYAIQTEEDKAVFTLWRTREDLEDLIIEAEQLGVSTVVGLYQEFCSIGRGMTPPYHYIM